MAGFAFSITNFLPQYQNQDLVLCNNGSQGLGAGLPAEVDLYKNFQVDTWVDPYWAYVQYDIRLGGCGQTNAYFGQLQMSLNNQTPQTTNLAFTYNAAGVQPENTLTGMAVERQGSAGAYWYKLTAQLPTPPTPPAPSKYDTVPYRGVNLAGAEFGPPPVMPSPSNAAYFIEQGMNTVRVPVLWEYLQPNLGTPIDWTTGYPQQVDQLIQTLLGWGLTVVFDVHNYMRYNNVIIGSGDAGAPTTNQFAQLWTSISTQYAGAAQMMFDLMNEPNQMNTQLILTNYNAAIAAIRAVESQKGVVAPHLILLEGNSWTGLHSWSQDQPGGSNASVFIQKNIQDSSNNYAINVHQYFDSDFSGRSGTCVSPSTVLSQINWSSFTAWMLQNKMPVIVTEFGSGGSSDCGQDINTFLTQVTANAFVAGKGGFIGWTIWSGGAFDSNYVLSINPGGPANPLLGNPNGYANFLTKPLS